MNVPNLMDNRRLEVVADGLLLFAGAQLVVDTAHVCPLHADGTHHRGASTHDGAILVEARRRKEWTYPELLLPGSRARLVVLALETGGRWSSEALAFVRLLARANARSEPQLMRKAGLAVPLVVSAHLAKTAFSQKTNLARSFS